MAYLIKGVTALTGPVRNLAVLAAALALLTAPLNAAPPDESEILEKTVTIKLLNASMADAVAALAKAADLQVVAPGEPVEGITLSLKAQTVRAALKMLSKAARLDWQIMDGVIVFEKPVEEASPEEPRVTDSLTPEQGMAALIGSLSPTQLFRISGNFSLSYGELTPYQQDILKGILSPPIIGVTAWGDVVRKLPVVEQTSVSFFIMPRLVLPRPGEKDVLNVRLDSAPYISLRKAAPK